jgi:predicted transposase YbfD/YdcC
MIKTLIEKLKKVNDFRCQRGKRYELWVLLLIIILGIMYGYTSYRGIGDFVKNHQDSFRKILKINSQTLPSYSTIRRGMEGVNWRELLDIFNKWADSLPEEISQKEWLSLDGKSAKNTLKNHQNNQQNFLVFVSVFSQKSGLVLHLRQFENKKSSEIKQVQDIARNTSFKNTVFTLDALHCQKETTSAIIQGNNNYLITVKKNQKKLYNTLIELSKNQKADSVFQEKDMSHGRNITRKISVFQIPNRLSNYWKKAQSFVEVIRKGKRGKKNYEQISYYISSISENAQKIAEKIRGHWKIENQLHWVKDVILGEDSCLISRFQAATNFSILQTIALNFFRILGFLSITEGQRWLSGKVYRLQVLLL